MELADLLVFGLALGVTLTVAPQVARANGTRPFLVLTLLFCAVLMAGSASAALWPSPNVLRGVRVAASLGILGCYLWASVKRH